MKPIEPGCLAVLIRGQFTGRVVTAVRFIGLHPSGCSGSHWWLCSAPWEPPEVLPFARERSLMRIDGFEETEDQELAEEIPE